MKISNFIIAASLVLSGCKVSTWEEPAVVGSLVVTSPVWVPAVGASSAYEGSVHHSQTGAIALGLNPDLYSHELNQKELMMIANEAHYHDCKMPVQFADWDYMGSTKDHHYLAYSSPHSSIRKIYRVRKSEYKIEDEFELTPDRKKWRSERIIPRETGNAFYRLNFQQLDGGLIAPEEGVVLLKDPNQLQIGEPFRFEDYYQLTDEHIELIPVD